MRLNRFLTFALLAVSAAMFLTSCEKKPSAADAAKFIPIQHNGQVKSFDSFSRQTVELITGKETWQHQSAVSVILEVLRDKDSAAHIPWIKEDYKALLEQLGLPPDKTYFSYDELSGSFEKIEALVRSSQSKRDQDIRPSKLEQKAETLFSKIYEVKHLISGKSLLVIPPKEGGLWLSPYNADALLSVHFKKIVELFNDKQYGEFDKKVRWWTNQINKMTGQKYRQKIALEVQYYNTRPFQLAWIFYLLAFAALSLFNKKPVFRLPGAIFLVAAIFFHTYGLILRILILSRPPVSNMYESMIYMNWVLIVAAGVFSIVKRNLAGASVGSLISAVIMIYGNLLPIDPNLGVLVPVLRSNYWLTIHVLTIVSSYGIFALAMGLGHRHLILDFRGKLSKKEEADSEKLIYRILQIGVLLIGMGTTLGGVWANESWGRFWGWDPKETWALITFLGYLVVIHLKFAKRVGPFTLAVCAVAGFLLVLMTWYGVNFVLGRGLHSYGQGSGGMIWVIYYLIFEALFLVVVLGKKLNCFPKH